jgi:hypothetical protein
MTINNTDLCVTANLAAAERALSNQYLIERSAKADLDKPKRTLGKTWQQVMDDRLYKGNW